MPQGTPVSVPSSRVNALPDRVAESLAPRLESGEWPGVVAGWIDAGAEVVACVQHRSDVFGIGRPVSRDVEVAVSSQLARQQVDKCRLHQTPLVVALLVPGIRKE